jgi:hypothetical protein
MPQRADWLAGVAGFEPKMFNRSGALGLTSVTSNSVGGVSLKNDRRSTVREDRNSASKYRALEKKGRWRRFPRFPLLGRVQRFTAPSATQRGLAGFAFGAGERIAKGVGGGSVRRLNIILLENQSLATERRPYPQIPRKAAWISTINSEHWRSVAAESLLSAF